MRTYRGQRRLLFLAYAVAMALWAILMHLGHRLCLSVYVDVGGIHNALHHQGRLVRLNRV